MPAGRWMADSHGIVSRRGLGNRRYCSTFIGRQRPAVIPHWWWKDFSIVCALAMLDGDEAGRLARDRVAARLRDRCEVRVIELPEGVQPDQLPDGRLCELMEILRG